MAISLAPELEQFVAAKVASGMYNSTNEVMQAALSLLAERDEQQRQRIAAMDALIQEGMDSGANGEGFTPEQMDADLDQLFVELKQSHA